MRGSTIGSVGFRLPMACWWPTPTACLGPGDLVGGTDCLHPNDAGHQRIAEAFGAVLAGADAQAAA